MMAKLVIETVIVQSAKQTIRVGQPRSAVDAMKREQIDEGRKRLQPKSRRMEKNTKSTRTPRRPKKAEMQKMQKLEIGPMERQQRTTRLARNRVMERTPATM